MGRGVRSLLVPRELGAVMTPDCGAGAIWRVAGDCFPEGT